ncbi:unnamed protein product [Absidia cylindrospora]
MASDFGDFKSNFFSKSQYGALIDEVIAYAKARRGAAETQLDAASDKLLDKFGKEVTVVKALSLFALYEAEGINKDRVLIKIASTWESWCPFVGLVQESYTAETDPGVIYNYDKQHGYTTIVIGVSFCNIGEIEQLTDCDYLGISRTLLDDLQKDTKPLERELSPDATPLTMISFFNEEKTFTGVEGKAGLVDFV